MARLFEVAAGAGSDGRFVAVAEAVERVIPGITGRELRLSVSAAIPAVLLDVGFPAEALRGVPILARCAGLIGHLTEELAKTHRLCAEPPGHPRGALHRQVACRPAAQGRGLRTLARVLQGLRVLEHGTFVTGPAAAMLLGDPFRAFRGGSCSPHDPTCNRNKKSVRLDTRQPGDRGHWIALHMSSPPRFRQGLAQAIDKPDRFDDARFATREARIAHHADLIQTLGSIFATRSREDWCQRLQALDVPHAPVHDTDEVPEDPQARHLQLFVDADHPAGGRWRSGRSLWSPRP